MAISVSRSTLDRHVLVDGSVSLVIDMEDGFSSIRICLEGGETLEFSRSMLPMVSGLCQHALTLLWDLYPGVAPELASKAPQSPQTVPYVSPLAGTLTPYDNEPQRHTLAPPPALHVKVPDGYGEPAPKPTARQGLPATEKQVGFIDNLGQANHLALEELLIEANKFQPGLESFDDIAAMDRKAASELIEHLKLMLEARKAQEGVPT